MRPTWTRTWQTLRGTTGRQATSAALDKTVDFATRAGDRATALFAFEEALRMYDMALTILESRGPEQRGAFGETLHKHGRVLAALGRWTEARQVFHTAASHLNGEDRVIALLGESGACLSWPIDVPPGGTAAEEALLLARQLGDAGLEAAAMALEAECDLDDGEIRRAVAQYGKAYSQGVHPRLPQHKQFLGFTRGLYWSGRIDEAVERGRETVTGARKVQDGIADVQTSTDWALALASSGCYREALEAFAYAKAGALALRGPARKILAARTIGMSCAIPMALFDYARAEVLAEEARAVALSAKFMLPYVSEGLDLMFIHSRRGEPDRADAMGVEIGDLLHHGVGSHGPIWAARLAEAKAEAALARGTLPEAVSLASEAAASWRARWAGRSTRRLLSTRGTALVRMARKREGIADLREAVEVARRIGDPAILVRAAVALLTFDGDAAVAADARSAVDRIVTNLPQDMKHKFEATEQVRLVRRLQEANAGEVAPRVLYADGLSEREVQVLRLIASGSSSREIGDSLVLSVRTVERHIANIYLKTETHGRAQVTATR